MDKTEMVWVTIWLNGIPRRRCCSRGLIESMKVFASTKKFLDWEFSDIIPVD